MSVESYSILAALLAIAFALYLAWKVNKFPEGEGKMLEISKAIKVGAEAFLNRQYRAVAYVAIVVAVVLYFILGITTALGFLVGAIASAAAGYIGMNVAVKGRAVSVNGSVGCVVTVIPGRGDG